MKTIIERLNLSLESEHLYEHSVVFSARNLRTVHKCKREYVEEALYNADYYEENGDYTQDDVTALVEIIDDYASEYLKNPIIADKQIWFDTNNK